MYQNSVMHVFILGVNVCSYAACMQSGTIFAYLSVRLAWWEIGLHDPLQNLQG